MSVPDSKDRRTRFRKIPDGGGTKTGPLMGGRPMQEGEDKDVLYQDALEMERVRRFKRTQRAGYSLFIAILCFLFVIFLAFLGGGLGWNTSEQDRRHSRNKLSIGNHLRFNSVDKHFHLGKTDEPSVAAVSGVLSAGSQTSGFAAPCTDYAGSGTCIEWPDQVRFSIETQVDSDLTCYTLSWQPLTTNFIPKDCFTIDGAHWYGGAEVSNQRWPIETGSQYDDMPFLPGGDQKDYDEALVERYWLSSNGVAIKADDSIPLHVIWNLHDDGYFCLVSNYSGPYKKLDNSFPLLKYHICQGRDLKSVHLAMAGKFFPKPTAVPDKEMLVNPVWSTWAKYHVSVNRSKVLEMAEEIVSEGYTHSQIEIDDKFSTTYGAFDFDEEDFPNATEFIQTLNSMGLRVTVWVTPFANVDSPVFLEGMKKKYWVQDISETVPALLDWWDGVAAILDVTNPEARKWFTDRLKAFQHTHGIHSFKFDAGTSVLLPSSYKLHSPLNNTAFFSTMFVEMCAQFGPMVEVRVGYRSQNQPIFFRLQDIDSKWDYENGLKSLIPRVLYFGLVGYPFVLPDMIGGNAYEGFPDRELFIRWLQVSAFLPSWQFSVTPRQYDNDTVAIAKKFMNIRNSFLKPYLLKYADEAVKTGMPIVRPLWWLAPSESACQTIDSQFLVGTDVLVAPILDRGAITRDVYIPAGTWRDKLTQKEVTGNTWLRDYSVPLEEIAYFVRQNV